MSITAGSKLGAFEIVSPLGKGGMGEVWLARDKRLGREVAIKVLPDEFTRDAERLARFDREARLLAALNHPHIASIYGLEESEGQKFLVMELAEGETLADRLDRGAIAVEDALAIARQVADALEAAHEKGIIHRDLKPGNIVVDADGNVRVLDFGLAKALDVDESSNSDITNSPTMVRASTGAGVILGTAAYMSPEQARGKRVDRRADIWAFGVLLWEMLSGRRLFRGETVSDTLAAVLRADVDLAALSNETPQGTRWLVARCLDRDPRTRLRDIGEARILLDESSVVSLTSSERTAGGASSSLHPIVWAALGLLVGALVVLSGSSLLRSENAPLVTNVSLEVAPAAGVDLGLSLDQDALDISRDGRTIAFIGSEGSGRGQLYVRHMDRTEATPLQGTTGAYAPQFAPDGGSVVFQRSGALFRIATGGGPVRPIAMPAYWIRSASVAHDGSLIVSAIEKDGENNLVLRVFDDGGRVETLATLQKGEVAVWPTLLPGEKGIVFTGTPEPLAIKLLDIASGSIETLAPTGMRPTWASTGHILYVDNGQLLALPFDPNGLKATGSAAPVKTGLSTGIIFRSSHFAVSENGTLVTVSQSAIDPYTDPLLWMTADGSTTSLGAPTAYYVDPRLSPDGRLLALSIPTGDNDIWVYDIERGNQTRLSFGEGEDETPVWSPDGTTVVWASQRDKVRSVVRKNRDGSGAEEVIWSDERHFHCADWTPDGSAIIVELNDPENGNDVYALSVGGEVEARPLLNGPYRETLPRLSPDGRWLAYVSNESESREVFMQPFPSLDRKVQLSVGGGTQPLWSHDGRALFYRADGRIMAVDIASFGPEPQVSKPRPALEQPIGFGKGGNHWGYDVAADGRFLVTPVESKFFPRRMEVTFGWFDELERLTSGHD